MTIAFKKHRYRIPRRTVRRIRLYGPNELHGEARKPRPGLRPTILLLTLLTGTACAPRIYLFDVQPHTLCSGDEKAVVHWGASGDLAMTVRLDPPMQSTALAGDAGPGDAASPPRGSEGSHDLVLRLTAKNNWGEAAQTRWIQYLPETFENVIAIRTVPAVSGVVAKVSKNPARWGDRFDITSVAALDGRRIDVIHAGKTASLAADGTPSAALNGTPLEGPWELRWSSEGGTAAPEILSVRAVVHCRSGRP